MVVLEIEDKPMFVYLITYLETVTGLAAFGRLKGLAQDRSGVTAIEYGLIAGLVAVAIVVAITLVGTNLNLVFGRISTALPTVAAS
jgi:pilus assembly protein Flp/PilA